MGLFLPVNEYVLYALSASAVNGRRPMRERYAVIDEPLWVMRVGRRVSDFVEVLCPVPVLHRARADDSSQPLS